MYDMYMFINDTNFLLTDLRLVLVLHVFTKLLFS